MEEVVRVILSGEGAGQTEGSEEGEHFIQGLLTGPLSGL